MMYILHADDVWFLFRVLADMNGGRLSESTPKYKLPIFIAFLMFPIKNFTDAL